MPRSFRFGEFELDVGAYALSRRGRRVRLERRPMDLLIMLVEQRNQLVPRTEIVRRLWGDDVFVEVDVAVNTAIRKVRQALHDLPDAPLFVETIQGKGYRFIADVEVIRPPSLGVAAHVTLAVLPFANLAASSEREYVADGFTEEAIAALGQIDPEHLCVIGRTSVMAYKASTKSLAEIGRELHADYLIEGSIRAEDERWRITSKLIRIPDQIQIWSASYDSEPSSVLEFQRELSTAIAEQIRLRLSPDRLTALERRQTRNAEACDLYLRGRHFWNQLTSPTNRRAMEYYARATALDPDYALAWCGIADALAGSPMNADACPLDLDSRAREAVEHALHGNPDLAETHTSVGLVNFWFNWDWVAAEMAYRKAIALDPSYALAHLQLGVVLAYGGRYEEASLAVQRARELDPLWALSHALSAHIEFIARNYASSLRFARQATVIGPEFWVGYFHLAQAYERLEDSQSAMNALRNAERSGPGNSKIVSLRGYLLARTGQENEARDVLSTLEALASERYVPPYSMALVCAGLDECDSACLWLERAYDVRDVHLVFLAMDSKWDPFRRDQRFKALLDRCGFGRGRAAE